MNKICAYCDKHKDVTQCPHCKKHFCSEHIKPIEPGSYHPEKSRVFVNQIRLGHENTHPCPDYVDYLEEQKIIHGKKYGEALDKLLGRTPKYKLPLVERQEIRDTRHNIAKENKEFNKSVNTKLEANIQRRKEDKIKRKELEKEKHRQEIEEKERISRDLEEKQKKHLKEQEEDEPYLYRYIPPEEQSRHPPKVQEKYKREQVVFERDGYIKRSFTEIRRYFKNNYYQIKHWSKNRPHRAYNNWHAFFINIIWIVALSIIFLIVYSNLTKLNEIVLWFLPLGGVLLIITLFFWIKYIIKIFKRGYYWFHGERNGIRYAIIFMLLLILWQAYQQRDTLFNPVIDFYDKTDFSAILPIGISESIPEGSVFSSKSVNSIKESVKVAILPQPIDSKWVSSFMSEVNAERKKSGLQPMKESSDLNAIAYARFNEMLKRPEISHYGAGAYNVGEVVFYPSGFTPEDYVTDIQNTAYLHWELLADPMFSYYGYYVGSGPTIQIYGACSSTEIPGPNINVEDYFKERGCQTSWGTSTWLVIDMT